MLDIISMITLIIIFSSFATFMMLIIIGGNMNKSEEEQRLEDEEQMEYLKQYREKKLSKKKENLEVTDMEEELYTWEQVRAYSVIALHNLLNSANDVSLKNIKMFIDPLQTLYGKDGVVGFSERLLEKENK